METQQPTEQQSAAVKKIIWVGVKEVARQLIGQPKPTKVRGNRKGRRSDGRQRAGMAGALDIYDSRETEQEYIPDAPRLATNPALHGAAITTVKSKYLHDARQRKHEKETLFHFSPEAIAHANFLQRTRGDSAMNQYLKEIKERRMDHLELAKAQVVAEEKKHQNVAGSIEEQYNQALTKAKHFREEAERLDKEADQQDKIALKLREVLDIMGGNTGKKPTERAPHGTWPARFKEMITVPMRRKDLIKEMNKRYGVKNAYGTVAKAVETGRLREVDGLLEFVEKE